MDELKKIKKERDRLINDKKDKWINIENKMDAIKIVEDVLEYSEKHKNNLSIEDIRILKGILIRFQCYLDNNRPYKLEPKFTPTKNDNYIRNFENNINDSIHLLHEYIHKLSNKISNSKSQRDSYFVYDEAIAILGELYFKDYLLKNNFHFYL